MDSTVQHDVPGIASLLSDSEARNWPTLCSEINKRAFLRSEGSISPIDAPQLIVGELSHACHRVAELFARFYHSATQLYWDDLTLRGEFDVNEDFATTINKGSNDPTVTLGRLDCVLTQSGDLRVIEMNPVGICLYHLRAVLYLQRELERRDWSGAASRLRTAERQMVDVFASIYRNCAENPIAKPNIGFLMPERFFRATPLLFRQAFQREGFNFVIGSPRDVTIKRDVFSLRGVRVDLLWDDFLMYLAYQCSKYQETAWPAKLGNYRDSPQHALAMLENENFIRMLEERRLVRASPMRAFLALSKNLLSWIHRDDVSLPGIDKSQLEPLVARTYSDVDRKRGVRTQDQVRRDRGQYVIKPTQYGGSHGVVIGADVDRDTWDREVAKIWDDSGWALQDYYDPPRNEKGLRFSLGAYVLEGKLGPVLFRSASSRVINARDSRLFVGMSEALAASDVDMVAT